jgi:hypothetical protein
MGKPTGFIEYQRLAEASEPAASRLKHYREFVRDPDRRTGEVSRAHAAWIAGSRFAIPGAR